MDRKANFTKIYQTNGFKGEESLSGSGSDLKNTTYLINELTKFVLTNKIKSMVDAPCGDFNWMKKVVEVTKVEYIGLDIVDVLIDSNNAKYKSETVEFNKTDLVTGVLPSDCDLLICRDCLVHLSFPSALRVLENIKKSNPKFILLTHFFNEDRQNVNFEDGTNWYPMNLCKAPFNLNEPLYLLDERCEEGNMMFTDKVLGLWNAEDL